jgi:hypothetical protein
MLSTILKPQLFNRNREGVCLEFSKLRTTAIYLTEKASRVAHREPDVPGQIQSRSAQ